jgi:hypothetical protein
MTLSLDEIRQGLSEANTRFREYCLSLSDDQFFFAPAGKWSAARQVKHLITATNTTRLAYQLPRFILRLVAGKPNRPSRSFDELVDRYNQKLEKGGRASGRYIPKKPAPDETKERLLNAFGEAMEKLSSTLRRKWNDASLDRYIAPHPLLGKITLRELGYFTIFHTRHHMESIRSMLKS